ncbi:ABC transporter ATP-binding protein [Mollicutes bacterium LVI A0078]|nr:ABC transporter ATP-binding protein [Mollicutes bacterium LVI A0075]WOO90061.1 ABC transporter ATP-binding protein [Mollicutes bacterium LVI A0078]
MKIQYNNLCIKRQNNIIIENFNLTIEDSNLCVIVGPSGSGKSTILEATAGLLAVQSGTIHFDDVDITKAKPQDRKIGYVFQDFALYPNMTVSQNIEFGLKVNKVDKLTRKQKIAEVLQIVDLTDFANRKPSELSGGQKQRVAIARALVLDPEILLMDEPLSSLDASLRATLRSQIVEIQKRLGKTIIFVTHDQSEALAMADQIVVLRDGQIEGQGTPFELYNNPSSEFILRFWSSEHINTITDQALLAAVNTTSSKMMVRPADIKLTAGNDYTVTDITLHGESQLLTLTGTTNLYVSVSSLNPINIGDNYNIEISNFYTF